MGDFLLGELMLASVGCADHVAVFAHRLRQRLPAMLEIVQAVGPVDVFDGFGGRVRLALFLPVFGVDLGNVFAVIPSSEEDVRRDADLGGGLGDGVGKALFWRVLVQPQAVLGLHQSLGLAISAEPVRSVGVPEADAAPVQDLFPYGGEFVLLDFPSEADADRAEHLGQALDDVVRVRRRAPVVLAGDRLSKGGVNVRKSVPEIEMIAHAAALSLR